MLSVHLRTKQRVSLGRGIFFEAVMSVTRRIATFIAAFFFVIIVVINISAC